MLMSDMDRQPKDDNKTVDKRQCQGCNRGQHERDTCQMTDHPDFIKTGLWTECGREMSRRESSRGLSELMVRH